jgi:pyruvate ferredoxin oxidoreductase gamma subunit
MYRIRFHGRGGQGIKTASRILGSAFFNEGFEVQDAPRYGAERRGAPIFAFVRAAREPIHERGIIRRPDLVVVADDSLVPVPAAGVLQGVDAHTVVLMNTEESESSWRDRLNLSGAIIVLPEDVRRAAELRFVGSACAGAAARLLGGISREALGAAVSGELAGLGPHLIELNLAQALAAYDAMADHEGLVAPGEPASAGAYAAPEWIDVPFEAARTSAPAIHAAATSEASKTGLWRTMRPIIDYDRCKGCWWVCSTFCPDGAIDVKDGRPEIDYDHCKGCMVCVAQCPPHAIAAVPEHEAAANE